MTSIHEATDAELAAFLGLPAEALPQAWYEGDDMESPPVWVALRRRSRTGRADLGDWARIRSVSRGIDGRIRV